VFPVRHEFRLAVIVSVALAVVAPSAVSAQSPSAYRAQLNRHCRTFTPRFKRIEADLKKAVGTKDPKLLAYALGQRPRPRAALRWLQRFIDARLPPLTEVVLAASALPSFDPAGEAPAPRR
jgi:hypothetical protein